MIRWIQSQKWQSATALALFALLLFGGADLFISDISSLFVAGLFSVAVFFAIRLPWLAAISVFLATILTFVLDVTPVFSFGSLLVYILLTAAFARLVVRITAFALTAVSAVVIISNVVFVSDHLLADFGLAALNPNARILLFVGAVMLMLSANTLAWLLGRLLITREIHVGTGFDRALAERVSAKLSLEVAEQNARFEIARDISELVIQRVSATISLAEGGSYAVAADASVAERVLGQITQSARSAHKELRRLFDMLNKLDAVSPAPPRIDDLDKLVVAFRELGFNISLNHQGNRFAISEGAELAIYRIAFDALENIRQHAPVGTDVSVEFSWTEIGMQLLIKDNGVEIANRGLSIEQLAYSIEEDRRALTETISGAGITAMAERAALYEGSIEATRVPGVGFTVSAIFANLKDSARD